MQTPYQPTHLYSIQNNCFSFSVLLCDFSVKLGEIKDYTDIHRVSTEFHREKL